MDVQTRRSIVYTLIMINKLWTMCIVHIGLINHKVKPVLLLKCMRLITMHAPPKQTVLTNGETAIQSHSRSSVVVPIDAAYMTSY